MVVKRWEIEREHLRIPVRLPYEEKPFSGPPTDKRESLLRFLPLDEVQLVRFVHVPACWGMTTSFSAAPAGRTLNHFSASAFVARPL